MQYGENIKPEKYSFWNHKIIAHAKLNLKTENKIQLKPTGRNIYGRCCLEIRAPGLGSVVEILVHSTSGIKYPSCTGVIHVCT